MGLPVVIVSSGGFPVSISSNNFGLPVEFSGNGLGIAITVLDAGGAPVVLVPPTGFVFLLGTDGAYLKGADGAYLLGVAP